MYGTVKWFSKQKGWGFVNGEDQLDYFVHFTSIVMDGYKNLLDGQAVEFTPGESAKGKVATEVKVLEVKAVEK